MKVKVSEVDKMIKEEFQKMMEKKKLSTKLAQINESLNEMDAEDKKLEEVEAGGLEKTKSATGLEPGVQHAVKFEKIGSALKEDGMEGMEPEMGAGEEVAVEAKPEMGEFEAKFAEIGRAIDAKMAAEGEAEVAPMAADTSADDDFEEVEVDGDGGDAVVVAGEEGADDKEEKELDEVVPVKESVEEPLEGHSVAQEVAADTVNDNMEKDTHVKEGAAKEGEILIESKTAKGNIFTEGLDDKKKSSLLEEMKRMKKFAGLSRDEE